MWLLFGYRLSAPNPPFSTQHSDTENKTQETLFSFASQLPHAATKRSRRNLLFPVSTALAQALHSTNSSW